LVKLLDLKFDMLVQLAPAFMLSLYWKGLTGRGVFTGILGGLGVTFGLYSTGWGAAYGIHYGLYGLVVNVVIATWISLAWNEGSGTLCQSPHHRS